MSAGVDIYGQEVCEAVGKAVRGWDADAEVTAWLPNTAVTSTRATTPTRSLLRDEFS
ncbi:hypothetical protein [Streptomyces sp. NPDC021356]|uniref:hypothetical protein n=1 Tax=Streptomyces sp. NPDC021356 TaxID=3154900 RepID=UPI0033E81156